SCSRGAPASWRMAASSALDLFCPHSRATIPRVARSRDMVIISANQLMWTILIFDAVAGLFLLWTAFALWHLRWVQRLPAREKLATADPLALPAKLIHCSVVIAARDEEARIEQTLRHLFAQRGVELEL